MKKSFFGTLIVAIILMCSVPLTSYAQDGINDTSNGMPNSELFVYENGENEEIVNNGTGDNQKIVSILGDSLGTYEGYTPWKMYYQYYCPENMSVSDTWWMHYIESNNMRLGVNESLGGSKVSWQEGEISGYSQDKCMASQERIDKLGENGTPDIILFFGGTNDIGSAELGNFEPNENIGDVSTFYAAYQTAIVRLKNTYPNAQIICLTPYYRDITIYTGAAQKDNDNVDKYAEAIIDVCEYYGIRCVDLRKANIDFYEEMCAPDYFHVNEKGAYKIWYMLQNECAQLGNNKIEILVNDGKTIKSKYEVMGADENTQYYWQVYDVSNDKWTDIQEEKSSEFEYIPPHEGVFWMHCRAVNKCSDFVEYTRAVNFECTTLKIDGLCWNMNDTAIDIGMAYTSEEEGTVFQWLAYDLDKKQWEQITEWSGGNWASWTPKKGNYWLQAQAKTTEGTVVTKTINFQVSRNYPVCINGTYQGPNPYGEGCLIGVSTNINPNNKYKYELLILDCEKYQNGDPNPWVYGTGLNTTNGTTFWATYRPVRRGYYWTYFRIYDENDNMIEDKCYGAYL